MNYVERDKLLKKESKRLKIWSIINLIVCAAGFTAAIILKTDWLKIISYVLIAVLAIRLLISYAIISKIRQDAENDSPSNYVNKRYG